MTGNHTVAPREEMRTFMNFPLVTDLDSLDAHIAIMGIAYSDPYTIDEVTNDQTNAPTAIRRESARISLNLDRWDFDIGGLLFDERDDIRVVDIGDAPGEARDLSAHYRHAEAAARQVFAKGAMLVTLGGDHGIPIPVFRALEDHGPITLVHIDAHLDWRDEVNGAREGYSSPIRRAAELDWFDRIVQIGLRAQGSAREGEVRDALAYGSDLITAYELHDIGMNAVLDRIPDGGNYYLTIDADGMDPTEMPAVAAPAPGGVTYVQMLKLIHGLFAKGRVMGMDIVEIQPKRDVNGITSLTAGRLIWNFIAAAVRSGQFDRD
ncbi:MAG: agmatinase [Alphaproteobacteria bacterium]|jgi:agmatinase